MRSNHQYPSSRTPRQFSRAARALAALLIFSSAAPALSSASNLPLAALDSRESRLGHIFPAWHEVVRVLTLQDYNTRVVVAGVTVYGIAAGVLGAFVLLRKRALLGDAISHAALPGVAGAFLVSAALGGTGKELSALLLGAVISSGLGMLVVLAIVHGTRLKEDAALALVLSVFFGLGVVLSVIAQKQTEGHAAGLDSFIYGRTAALLARDAQMILVGAVLVLAISAMLFKELRLLCFDPGFAAAQGWPVLTLDILLMALVVGVTVLGLQAVGLILVIAMIVIPPAAARFWTHRLDRMALTSGVFGAGSGFLGALLSALTPRLPSGAMIVLVAGFFFALSALFGPARGWVPRQRALRRLNERVAEQHLLRSMYELTGEAPSEAYASRAELIEDRAWSPAGMDVALRRAVEHELIVRAPGDEHSYALTENGRASARRVTRNHRLWELYLIAHADIAPSHVDRDADMVEHVLDPAMIDALEVTLARDYPDLADPPSPHAVARQIRQTGALT